VNTIGSRNVSRRKVGERYAAWEERLEYETGPRSLETLLTDVVFTRTRYAFRQQRRRFSLYTRLADTRSTGAGQIPFDNGYRTEYD